MSQQVSKPESLLWEAQDSFFTRTLGWTLLLVPYMYVFIVCLLVHPIQSLEESNAYRAAIFLLPRQATSRDQTLISDLSTSHVVSRTRDYFFFPEKMTSILYPRDNSKAVTAKVEALSPAGEACVLEPCKEGGLIHR